MSKLLLINPINDKAFELYNSHKHYNEGDSGLDLYIIDDIEISLGETKFINLGIRCEMLSINNYVNACGRLEETRKNISYYLYGRSSLSKTPLIIPHHVGIIDAGYRGPIILALKYVPTHEDIKKLKKEGKNYEIPKYLIKAGSRLAQLCSPDLSPFKFKLVDTLSTSQRNEGGFGSTGK